MLRHAVSTPGKVPVNKEIDVSAEQNLRIVQDMYAAFGRGDIGFVLERIADDCDDFCVISGTETGVPWHLQGKSKGKGAAARYFEALGSTVDHTVFEPRDFAATGDHVYATVKMQMVVRATGRKIEHPEVIHHFTFRDERVVRCRATEDTARTAAAFAK